jgi:hypothetical protein
MLARKLIVISVALAAAAGLSACGDSKADSSIPFENAQTLITTLEEIKANVDNGSCEVALDKVDELKTEIEGLPSDVSDELKQELLDGADQIAILVRDPDQCEQPQQTTTTEQTTTEQTTTQQTTTEQTQPTTTTQPTTPTTPTTPGGGGGTGGLGPTSP